MFSPIFIKEMHEDMIKGFNSIIKRLDKLETEKINKNKNSIIPNIESKNIKSIVTVSQSESDRCSSLMP